MKLHLLAATAQLIEESGASVCLSAFCFYYSINSFFSIQSPAGTHRPLSS